MKTILAFLFFITCIACNKPPYQCDIFPDQSIEIKFLNQQGQNIIAVPNASYLIDSIKVLKFKNSFNIHNASVQKGLLNPENIKLYFYTPETKSFIYYNQQTASDTLEINWVIKAVNCERGGSMEYNAVDAVKFNSILIEPVDGVYTFIK